jgi:hypothetical protein
MGAASNTPFRKNDFAEKLGVSQYRIPQGKVQRQQGKSQGAWWDIAAAVAGSGIVFLSNLSALVFPHRRRSHPFAFVFPSTCSAPSLSLPHLSLVSPSSPPRLPLVSPSSPPRLPLLSPACRGRVPCSVVAQDLDPFVVQVWMACAWDLVVGVHLSAL